MGGRLDIQIDGDLFQSAVVLKAAKCDDARTEMERMMQKEEPVREKPSRAVPIKEDLVRDEPEGRVL